MKKVIGFVDDCKAKVTINGINANQQGHYFWVDYTKLGIAPGKAKNLEIVATDQGGSRSIIKTSFFMGGPPKMELDQGKGISYAINNLFSLSGNINDLINQIMINGSYIQNLGNKFKTELSIEEGFNLTKIEYYLGMVMQVVR